MKNPTFIQIDSGIYGDAKVTILMRKHGALGIALFLYSLIQINHNPDTGLLIDDLFMECAAVQHNADIDDVREVVSKLISLGLLYEDSGLYHSIGYDKRTGTYIEANIKRSETQKQNAADKAKDEASAKAKPQATAKAKPVVKESLTPESEQITRLRGYAKAIFDEIGNCKNKPELSTEQYQKLIDKWGFDKLVILQRVFYEWKAIKKDKATATDFGTLFKKGWVHEKADKLSDSSQYDSGNTPTPEPRENPPSGGWLYPFPKPEGLDGMEFYAKKELLSKLMSEYNASKEALNPKPASNPEPPKEDFWKYDFPKPEFWDGMKQAAKDAYIARETMKEVENVLDSLPD